MCLVLAAPTRLLLRCMRVSSLEVRPNLSSFADQLAVMYVTQAPPFFEIFVRKGNGSRSEQQS